MDCTVNDAAIEEMILLFALDILSECLPPSAPTPCFFYTPDEKRSDATAFAACMIRKSVLVGVLTPAFFSTQRVPFNVGRVSFI